MLLIGRTIFLAGTTSQKKERQGEEDRREKDFHIDTFPRPAFEINQLADGSGTELFAEEAAPAGG